MMARQVFWPILASVASLLAAGAIHAQPKATPAVGTGSAQIIPVSFKNEQIAATVNGEKILVGAVRKVLDSQPYPLSLTESQKKEMRQAALESLVDDTLLRQYLSKQVPQVSQLEFNKEVQDLQDALKKQNKTLDMFYKETGQTEEQLRRDMIARVQWRLLLLRMCPDDKAKVYFDANKVFFDKVYVRASHILIKLDPKTTKEQRAQAMQQMLVWRQDILAGKVKFDDVAKQYSQCPSKDKGGDIGEFPYKFVVMPDFARVAFAMKKNEVSDVVQTSVGLHLILVTDRSAGELSNFATLKDTVREVWARDQELHENVLAEQRKTSQIKIDLP